ncbi:MAG: hypothetical protein NUV77_08465 [Thermoguttaceae bacterium]|jgi:hypothetical protein|nr:hypothetical protein [Thermoguttaceae bacterium]
MDQSSPAAGLVAVCVLGIGGSVAALAFLWLELRRRFHQARTLSGALALVLGLGSAVSFFAGQPAEIWGASAALASVCATAFVLHFSSVRKAIAWFASPTAVWGIVLVAAPASAILLAWSLNQADECPIPPAPLLVDREEVPQFHLVTDAGRRLPVYNLIVAQSATEFEEAFIAERHFACRVIRTGDPDPTHNCHGWVFTQGRFALRPEDVEEILADNHYEKVTDPQPGDLIIYRNLDGQIEHTGLVRSVIAGEIVLIESKWGPLGRFLHAPEDQPYGTDYAYYRSPRPGHLVTIVEEPRSP